MSELSPLSGVKQKLDFGAVRADFDPTRTSQVIVRASSFSDANSLHVHLRSLLYQVA